MSFFQKNLREFEKLRSDVHNSLFKHKKKQDISEKNLARYRKKHAMKIARAASVRDVPQHSVRRELEELERTLLPDLPLVASAHDLWEEAQRPGREERIMRSASQRTLAVQHIHDESSLRQHLMARASSLPVPFLSPRLVPCSPPRTPTGEQAPSSPFGITPTSISPLGTSSVASPSPPPPLSLGLRVPCPPLLTPSHHSEEMLLSPGHHSEETVVEAVFPPLASPLLASPRAAQLLSLRIPRGAEPSPSAPITSPLRSPRGTKASSPPASPRLASPRAALLLSQLDSPRDAHASDAVADSASRAPPLPAAPLPSSPELRAFPPSGAPAGLLPAVRRLRCVVHLLAFIALCRGRDLYCNPAWTAEARAKQQRDPVLQMVERTVAEKLREYQLSKQRRRRVPTSDLPCALPSALTHHCAVTPTATAMTDLLPSCACAPQETAQRAGERRGESSEGAGVDPQEDEEERRACELAHHVAREYVPTPPESPRSDAEEEAKETGRDPLAALPRAPRRNVLLDVMDRVLRHHEDQVKAVPTRIRQSRKPTLPVELHAASPPHKPARRVMQSRSPPSAPVAIVSPPASPPLFPLSSPPHSFRPPRRAIDSPDGTLPLMVVPPLALSAARPGGPTWRSPRTRPRHTPGRRGAAFRSETGLAYKRRAMAETLETRMQLLGILQHEDKGQARSQASTDLDGSIPHTNARAPSRTQSARTPRSQRAARATPSPNTRTPRPKTTATPKHGTPTPQRRVGAPGSALSQARLLQRMQGRLDDPPGQPTAGSPDSANVEGGAYASSLHAFAAFPARPQSPPMAHFPAERYLLARSREPESQTAQPPQPARASPRRSPSSAATPVTRLQAPPLQSPHTSSPTTAARPQTSPAVRRLPRLASPPAPARLTSPRAGHPHPPSPAPARLTSPRLGPPSREGFFLVPPRMSTRPAAQQRPVSSTGTTPQRIQLHVRRMATPRSGPTPSTTRVRIPATPAPGPLPAPQPDLSAWANADADDASAESAQPPSSVVDFADEDVVLLEPLPSEEEETSVLGPRPSTLGLGSSMLDAGPGGPLPWIRTRPARGGGVPCAHGQRIVAACYECARLALPRHHAPRRALVGPSAAPVGRDTLSLVGNPVTVQPGGASGSHSPDVADDPVS